MKNELFDAIAEVGDDLVTEAEAALTAGHRRPVYSKIALAASFAVVVLGTVLFVLLRGGTNRTSEPLSGLTAAQAYDMLYGDKPVYGEAPGGETQFYVTRYGDLTALAATVTGLPEGTLPILSLDMDDGFSISPKITECLRAIQNLTGEDMQYGGAFSYYTVENETSREVRMGAKRKDNKTVPFLIDGKEIAFEEEGGADAVLAAVNAVKDRLNEVFGTDFDRVDISGFERMLCVNEYFDLEAADPVSHMFWVRLERDADSALPPHCSIDRQSAWTQTPAICLLFENGVCTTINRVYGFSMADEKEYPVLPIEKAEEYLAKGYVFDQNLCPLCAMRQTPVSFASYELVFVEYRFGPNGDGIPFYTFAKKSDDFSYLTVQIPAIVLDGYEAFCEERAKEHGAIHAALTK